MVDPTFAEQMMALALVGVFVIFIGACVAGLSIRAKKFARQFGGGTRAEVDAKIVIAESINVNSDPTIPFSPYAAVNEARQRRARKG